MRPGRDTPDARRTPGRDTPDARRDREGRRTSLWPSALADDGRPKSPARGAPDALGRRAPPGRETLDGRRACARIVVL